MMASMRSAPGEAHVVRIDPAQFEHVGGDGDYDAAGLAHGVHPLVLQRTRIHQPGRAAAVVATALVAVPLGVAVFQYSSTDVASLP